jgi:hypothetical protein
VLVRDRSSSNLKSTGQFKFIQNNISGVKRRDNRDQPTALQILNVYRSTNSLFHNFALSKKEFKLIYRLREKTCKNFDYTGSLLKNSNGEFASCQRKVKVDNFNIYPCQNKYVHAFQDSFLLNERCIS